jgi:RNA polymerase sigma-70 factor (ECF subfamily)
MQFFLRRVASRAEAEDLTQQVFLRLLGRDGDEPGAPLVFRIAANLLRDRARSRRTWGDPLPLDGDLDLAQLDGEAEARTPERILLSRERLADVLRTLDGLGQRTRDIFILFRLENMSHAEIAALFGCSRSAVEKHVMKATYRLLQTYRGR